MRRAWLVVPSIFMSLLGLSLLSLGATPLEQQPPAGPTPTPRPAPAEDRVGYPEGYQTAYQTFFVMDRPDNKQVRVIYANDQATQGSLNNFPYGSIFVMETYRAKEDEQGNVVLEPNRRVGVRRVPP
jgi:hypothetical protein